MAPKSTPKPTYAQWLRQVDVACYDKAGLSYRDLDDYCYADAYANGKSAKATAAAAIRNAGW